MHLIVDIKYVQCFIYQVRFRRIVEEREKENVSPAALPQGPFSPTGTGKPVLWDRRGALHWTWDTLRQSSSDFPRSTASRRNNLCS